MRTLEERHAHIAARLPEVDRLNVVGVGSDEAIFFRHGLCIDNLLYDIFRDFVFIIRKAVEACQRMADWNRSLSANAVLGIGKTWAQ